MSYEEFAEKIKNASKIKCLRWNIMSGKGVYHILGFFDDHAIALKYYQRKHGARWIYSFTSDYALWTYYKNDWIVLL